MLDLVMNPVLVAPLEEVIERRPGGPALAVDHVAPTAGVAVDEFISRRVRTGRDRGESQTYGVVARL